MLRYALHLDRDDGSTPEDIVLGDRMLQALAVLWMVAFAVGVYSA